MEPEDSAMILVVGSNFIYCSLLQVPQVAGPLKALQARKEFLLALPLADQLDVLFMHRSVTV